MEKSYKQLKENFNKFLKEDDGKKWQVIFWDVNHEETPVEQLFDSEKEAEDWVTDLWYMGSTDDWNGSTHFEDRFFNPEDKESYWGYEIKPVSEPLMNQTI